MNDSKQFNWRNLARIGLLAGAVIIYTASVGMLEVFGKRELIQNVLSLGLILLVAPAIGAGFFVSRKTEGIAPEKIIASGAIVGFFASLPVILLIVIEGLINIRKMFVSISPGLIELLTFGIGRLTGSIILVVGFVIAGVLGAGINLISPMPRRAILVGATWALGVGLMSELLTVTLRPLFGSGFTRLLFQSGALRPLVAIIIFFIAGALTILWAQRKDQIKQKIENLNPSSKTLLQRSGIGVGTIMLLLLPWVLGTFLSEVLSNVGLYILMGLGLNIAVGLAGLLDLGYVTNFAVGAYIAGILTTTGELGGAHLPFWIIIPISILLAMFTGFILALPVLRMRGDYLAIATLGFGEIIRILALSDWLAPLIGGAQGILDIPNPSLGGFTFSGPQQIYYIILGACLLAVFVSSRLNNSRTGRQWMALREDEDVAAAMGIDTVKSKMLAFTISAATGGLAGSIFAAKLGTIFPHSFQLLISINVLSLIIVGGMGSLPGIIVGALFLIGLPELLREFAEYRLLLYGALLIIMMLARPEGLWPSAVRRRELAADDSDEVVLAPTD
jgi:branched-chain amino acid transport system permease protein